MTCEQDCHFIASSSDSEVANESTEEFDIGVAGAEPVKKARVWSSFIEESEVERDKSDLENTASVSESSSEENTTMVSSYEDDSEYFSHKSIITQSMEYITASHFSHTMNFIYNHNNYYIREYGSTLYVGLARAVSPTNTNFRLTFLLTRLQEALYEDLAV